MLEWLVEKLTPKPLLGRAREYGILSIGISAVMAVLLVFQQADLLALGLPIIAAGCVTYRVVAFAILHLMLALYALDSISFYWNPEFAGFEALFDAWMVLPILVQLMFSLRCLALAAPKKNRAGINCTVQRSEDTFRSSEMLIGGMIGAAAWLLAGCILICLEPWVVYAPVFELKREGMRIVILIAVLFVLFSMILSFLSYMKNRSMDAFEGKLVLQNVVWRWIGNEQSMIAKAENKRRKKETRSAERRRLNDSVIDNKPRKQK